MRMRKRISQIPLLTLSSLTGKGAFPLVTEGTLYPPCLIWISDWPVDT